MSNSDKFYNLMQEYQDERKRAVDEYEHRRTELERTRGSLFFDEETAKNIDKKNTALENLQMKFFPAFQFTFNEMNEANSKRGMQPPTQEQLNLLAALRMKQNLTETDYISAAHTLADNGLALNLLQELARERGSLHNYMKYGTSKELSVPTVEQALKNLWDSVNDFLRFDTTKASRLNRRHQERYGATAELNKRQIFNTKTEMFSQIAGFSEDDTKAFCAAVDGE